MSEEWREFDLSALTYPEFLAFIFDRPVVSHPEAYQLFHSGLEILVSDPVIVVDHVRKTCKELGGLRSSYSIEQMDQGLWALFGTVISRGEFFDSVVNPSMRIECIESMYIPFAEVATDFTSDIRETFYWMWWDIILHHFWQMADLYEFDYAALTDDHKQMLESMYQTLMRILAIEHMGCQICALHGLGHLHHPLVPEAVTRYLDTHRSEFDHQDRRWIEECRDGTVL